MSVHKVRKWTLYTSEVQEEDFELIDDTIFPSLFQRKIAKEYEIRSFFIDGQFYSMAIFSQKNAQTKVDFREYDHEVPNQTSTYQLPGSVQEKLTRLMEALKLDTGSIDLIRTLDGEYVFLEVNPVGQFDNVSYFCNYNLEKIIAQALINRDQ